VELIMRKLLGGALLLIAAIYLLRNGVTTDAVLGQAGKVLDRLVDLGAELAKRTPAGGAS